MRYMVIKEAKMTSIEVVELINNYRKMEGKSKELSHSDFCEKVRKELDVLESLGLDGGVSVTFIKYRDNQSEERFCFELNRIGILQTVISESTFVRHKIIEYINELEKKIRE